MDLEVYSQSINRGVVKMPSQHFPGLVLQGEMLSTLLSLAKSVHEKTQQISDTELIASSRELEDNLQTLLAHFESTLHRHNIPLPYATVVVKTSEA